MTRTSYYIVQAVETVPLVVDRREHSTELKVRNPVSAPENRSVLPTAV
jgi:hypothetical protein